MTITSVKRALLSVSDKTGIVAFARGLHEQGVEIFSTGGTSQTLRDANIAHRQVEDLTRMPEMLDGRVKTLHPQIHGGILGKRDTHAHEAEVHGLHWIDLVVVNFYPFEKQVTDQSMPWSQVVEYIDVGGPTMVRAAAKNFAWVGVVVDPEDYTLVLNDLQTQQGLNDAQRRRLAAKAFEMTARYDHRIHDYFIRRETVSSVVDQWPAQISLPLTKQQALRYGENPHQQAAVYSLGEHADGLLGATQHQGKPLSYNNLLDADAALRCVAEFDTPACVVVKHANPCGVATAHTIDEAFTRAWQADSVSAFGGIIALNQCCTAAIASALTQVFVEVLLAPAFSPEALRLLADKPNVRVLAVSSPTKPTMEMRVISGGVLMQAPDDQLISAQELSIVTQSAPSASALETLLFAWRVLKHVKSNGILIAKDDCTVGIGAGQVSRIDAVDIALRKAGDRLAGAVLASDAFFPFRDSIDRLAGSGIIAIIQPGGSVRDQEVIDACDAQGIAMVFTGKRCFKH